MLVAQLDELRIEAWLAQKGPKYSCPNCSEQVTLKKGRLVIHHFAHQPGAHCSWASGETREHMHAKRHLAEGLEQRGVQVEIEKCVLSLAGDGRADLLLTNGAGNSDAIEIQHTPIDYEGIERRTKAYVAANIPVAWVGILTEHMKGEMARRGKGYVISKFSPRPWQKWVHAYNFKEIWFVDPENGELWRGEMTSHMLEVASSEWYNEYGEEQSAGGYVRHSKRWRDLSLEGPFQAANIQLSCPRRNKPWSGGRMNLPVGRFLRFTGPASN